MAEPDSTSDLQSDLLPLAADVWQGVLIALQGASFYLLAYVLVGLEPVPRMVVMRVFIVPIWLVVLLCFVAWQIVISHPWTAVLLVVASLGIVVGDGTFNVVFDVLHEAFESENAEEGPSFLLFFGICVAVPLVAAYQLLEAIRRRRPVVSVVPPDILSEPIDLDDPAPSQFEAAADLLRAQARKHQGGPESARFMRAAAEIETADTIAKLKEILGDELFDDKTIQQALRRAGIRVD